MGDVTVPSGISLPLDYPSLNLIGASGAALPYAEVNSIVDSASILHPGRATVTVRNLAAVAEQGFISLTDNVVTKLPGYSRVQIKSQRTGETLFIGNLMRPKRSWSGEHDSMILQYEDDRCFLRKIPMRGCFVYDQAKKAVVFLNSYEPHLNPEGYQNCCVPTAGVAGLFSDDAFPYLFSQLAAQGTWGINDDSIIGVSDQVNAEAGDGICWTAFRWLQYCISYLTYAMDIKDPAYGRFTVLDSSKIKMLCGGIPNDPHTERKMPDMTFKGKNAAQALHAFEEVNSAYGLRLQYNDDGTSSIIPYIRRKELVAEKKKLFVQTSGTPNFQSVWKGEAESDYSNIVTGTLVEGGRPHIEAEFIWTGVAATSSLIPAWGTVKDGVWSRKGDSTSPRKSQELDFMYIVALAKDINDVAIPNLTACSPQALALARASYPKVFRAYRLYDNKEVINQVTGHINQANIQTAQSKQAAASAALTASATKACTTAVVTPTTANLVAACAATLAAAIAACAHAAADPGSVSQEDAAKTAATSSVTASIMTTAALATVAKNNLTDMALQVAATLAIQNANAAASKTITNTPYGTSGTIMTTANDAALAATNANDMTTAAAAYKAQAGDANTANVALVTTTYGAGSIQTTAALAAEAASNAESFSSAAAACIAEANTAANNNSLDTSYGLTGTITTTAADAAAAATNNPTDTSLTIAADDAATAADDASAATDDAKTSNTDAADTCEAAAEAANNPSDSSLAASADSAATTSDSSATTAANSASTAAASAAQAAASAADATTTPNSGGHPMLSDIMRGAGGTTDLSKFPWLAWLRPLLEEQLQPYLEYASSVGSLKRADQRVPVRIQTSYNYATSYANLAAILAGCFDVGYNNGVRPEKDGFIYFDGLTDDLGAGQNANVYTGSIQGYGLQTPAITKIDPTDNYYPQLRAIILNAATVADGLPGNQITIADSGGDFNGIAGELDPSVVESPTSGPILQHYIQNPGFKTEHQVNSKPALDGTLTTVTIQGGGSIGSPTNLAIPAGGVTKELRSDYKQLTWHMARRHEEMARVNRVQKYVLPGCQYTYKAGDFITTLTTSDGLSIQVNDFIANVELDFTGPVQQTTLHFGGGNVA